MVHLIVGYGEVGQGLEKVLIEQHGKENVYWVDQAATNYVGTKDDINILHICFPYCKGFVDEVLKCLHEYRPWDSCIIHSTVKTGTTRMIQLRTNTSIVISPIQGNHPDLDKGIRAFKKWVGVKSEKHLDEGNYIVDKVFPKLRCRVVYPYEAVELAKLLDLSRYGLLISFAKEQNEICKEHGVTYSEVVKEWELDYNEGLLLEGRTEYTRPIIYPPEGEIGGHCIIPAMEKIQEDSKLIQQALSLNYDNISTTITPLDVQNDVEIGEGTKTWHYINILKGAKIGKNCNIGSYVEIGRNVRIGNNCKIEAGAFIPEGVEIGNNVFIGPNVVFTNDRYPRIGKEWNCEKTIVEDNVSIGANSTIRCGITLGEGCMIGAGSVITKNIPHYETWVGNPIRKIGICKQIPLKKPSIF